MPEPLDLDAIRERLDPAEIPSAWRYLNQARSDLRRCLAVIEALRAALAPFAYPTEADGVFLVLGKDVNRARAALARVTGGTDAEDPEEYLDDLERLLK